MRYKTICKECGSSNLEGGYDVMLPLNKETLELSDYCEGTFNEYVWCHGCDNECMEIEEVKIDETKQIS